MEQKAEALATASQYKSEFLANMSHELRTPLNSILILARLLADNETKNLEQDQIESAQIIYQSGSDLLALINDILDLSKVEAGQLQFHIEEMSFSSLKHTLEGLFTPQAKDKGLNFEVIIEDDVPEIILSDRHRVEQILRNFISNAIKFTDTGQVRVSISRPDAQINLSTAGLQAEQSIALGVADTGIGISLEQQKYIFEAFQQVDGGINRRYGGTGLGLTISRELARLLGGEIDLKSTPNEGSLFTLYLPETLNVSEQDKLAEGPYDLKRFTSSSPQSSMAEADQAQAEVDQANLIEMPSDDRDHLSSEDAILLIGGE